MIILNVRLDRIHAEDHLDVIDSATTTPTDTTTASITTSQPFPTSTDVPQPDVSVLPDKNHLPANLHPTPPADLTLLQCIYSFLQTPPNKQVDPI